MGNGRAGPEPADERDLRSYLAAMVHSSPDSIVGVSLDGTITSWNHGAARLTGYAAEEIVGHSLTELLPPDRAPGLADLLERVRHGEMLPRSPATVIRKDGTPVDVAESVWPIRDRTGTVIGAASITLDQTEEDRLRSQLAAIVESSADAIIGTDADAVITSWNSGAEQMFGYTAAEIAGHSIAELAPATAPDPKLLIERLQRGGRVRDDEAQIRRKDGSVACVAMSLSPIRDRSGRVTGASAVAREQAQAQQLRAELAAVTQFFPDAIVGLSLAGIITSWNSGAEQLYGYPADEIVGHSLAGLLPPDLRRDLLPLLKRIEQGEPVTDYRTRAVRKDGTTAAVAVSVTPVRDRTGAVTAAVSVARGIQQPARAGAGPGRAGERDLPGYLTAAVESAPDAFIGVSLDQIVTSWNPAAERLAGYTADEVIGHPLATFVAPARAPGLGEMFERLARGETLTRYQAAVVRKDGTPIEVLLTVWPVRDRTGAVIGTAAVPQDPAGEDRLRSYLAAIGESSDEAIIGTDVDAVITSWNPAAERMLGYPAPEMIGHSLAELTAAGPDPKLLIERLQRGEAVRNDERQLRRKDGTMIDVSMSMSPIRDRSGAVIGAASATRELTEADRLRSQLATIAESSSDAIAGLALDGTITSWNAGAERMYGYPADEIIGQSVLKLSTDAGTAGQVQSGLGRLLRAGGPSRYEGTARRRDGTVIDVSVSLSPIRDRSGAVTGIASLSREPTEADRLRSQLAAIVESSPDTIIGVTLDGTITSWNAGAERMYGYTADEIIGQNVRTLTADPGMTAAYLPPALGQLRRGEGPIRYEGTGRRKDGSVIAIAGSLSPVRDRSGAVTAAAALAWELPAADRLRSQLAAIAESASESIIGLDLEGNVTSWNSGAEQMYGYTAEEMIGNSVLTLVPPGEQHDTESVFARLLSGEQVRNYEALTRRKDGTIVPVLTSMSAIWDRGEMIGTALVSRDISERVRAEEERRAAEERQRQAERIETVSQLAGRVAHDFNNLLSTIMGYAGLVADAAANLPDIRADVGQILDAARRASRLSRDLLLISRREPVRVESLDLNRVLAELRGLLSASVGEHIRLRYQTAAVPTVQADLGQLEQVILNLAVNARDAMPDGGPLTFTTRTVDAEAAAGGGPVPCAELAVTDTGSGMSPEVASRAFEPFFTTKPPDEGTGLGLSTVHSLVTEAGGTITVESEEGTGTTFRIRLPAAGVPAAPAAADGEAPRKGHGEQVLVVDDEPAVLAAAARILSRNGYATLQASTAEEALALLSAQDVQLMLADSVMPGMPGTALAEQARELKPGLRILHMSGYRPPSLAGQEAAFIPKPFTAQMLLGKVREVLDAPAAGGSGASP